MIHLLLCKRCIFSPVFDPNKLSNFRFGLKRPSPAVPRLLQPSPAPTSPSTGGSPVDWNKQVGEIYSLNRRRGSPKTLWKKWAGNFYLRRRYPRAESYLGWDTRV